MISYYTSLLLIVLLLQTNKVDVLRTIITLIIVSTSNLMMQAHIIHGYSIYQSAVQCEVIYLIFLVLTFRLHKSKVLFYITTLSLLWNLLLILPSPYYVIHFVYTFSSLFNIILFECLLYNCANTTRLVVFMKKYVNTIKENKTQQNKDKVKLC